MNTTVVRNDHMQVGECAVRPDSRTSYITKRIGPFSSTGGGWFGVSIKWPFGEPEDAAITGYGWAPVTATGDIIPLPPFHFHHHHFFEDGVAMTAGVGADAFREGCETAPDRDNACYVQDFHTLGSVRVGRWHSPGANPADPPAADLDMMLHDLRPEGSPPLTWWLQGTYRFEHGGDWKKTRYLSVSGLVPGGLPEDPDAYTISEGFGGVHLPTGGPSQGQSHVVFSWEWPVSGQIMGFQQHDVQVFHSHMLMMDSMLLIKGGPQHLTLPLEAHATRLPATNETKYNCLWQPVQNRTTAELRSRVLASVRSRVVCQFEGQLSKPIDKLYYDRLAKGSCETTPIKQGEVFSAIAFFRPRVRENYGGSNGGKPGPIPTSFNMHVTFNPYLVVEEPEPADLSSLSIVAVKQSCASDATWETATTPTLGPHQSG